MYVIHTISKYILGFIRVFLILNDPKPVSWKASGPRTGNLVSEVPRKLPALPKWSKLQARSY
jgi:hypothetical protein